jgi:hypothetical protein
MVNLTLIVIISFSTHFSGEQAGTVHCAENGRIIGKDRSSELTAQGCLAEGRKDLTSACQISTLVVWISLALRNLYMPPSSASRLAW